MGVHLHHHPDLRHQEVEEEEVRRRHRHHRPEGREEEVRLRLDRPFDGGQRGIHGRGDAGHLVGTFHLEAVERGAVVRMLVDPEELVHVLDQGFQFQKSAPQRLWKMCGERCGPRATR